jgi:hypothetical protein
MVNILTSKLGSWTREEEKKTKIKAWYAFAIPVVSTKLDASYTRKRRSMVTIMFHAVKHGLPTFFLPSFQPSLVKLWALFREIKTFDATWEDQTEPVFVDTNRRKKWKRPLSSSSSSSMQNKSSFLTKSGSNFVIYSPWWFCSADAIHWEYLWLFRHLQLGGNWRIRNPNSALLSDRKCKRKQKRKKREIGLIFTEFG